MVAAALAFLVLAAAPPVPHSPVSTGPAERGLATWMPGEVRCDGGAAVGKPIRRPLGTIGWRGSNSRQSVTLRFDIDGSGRPISITREDRATSPMTTLRRRWRPAAFRPRRARPAR
ncbi:hypothetical protein QUC32_14445 [Novosphingobium resinovorum]|uniref:hypothetical protein n=1 Tax=Novosphingobium TaxID=165696 RepID=UPI002004ECF6|nr:MULTISPECIES: hypothetical protein [Novosphingobium]WJM28866.1 hypothetical protein QUC32_14445 [Novosphingobium resinovorum]